MFNITLSNTTNQHKKTVADAVEWINSNGQFAVDVMHNILGTAALSRIMRVIIQTSKYYGNDFFHPSHKLYELGRTSRRTFFRATKVLREKGWISTDERTSHNLPRYKIHWEKIWEDIYDYLRQTNKFAESVVPSPSDDPFEAPPPTSATPKHPVDNLWKTDGFPSQSCQNGTTHLRVLNNNINNNTLLGNSKPVDNSSTFSPLIPFPTDAMSDDEWMQIGEEMGLSSALIHRARQRMADYYAAHPDRKSRNWLEQWRRWLSRYKANLNIWLEEQNRHKRTIAKPRYRLLNSPQPKPIEPPPTAKGVMTKVGELIGNIFPALAPSISTTSHPKEIFMSKASIADQIPLASFSTATPEGKVRDQLLQGFGQATYVSWFQNAGIAVQNARVTITVSNAFKRDFIQREYFDRIKNILKPAEVLLAIGATHSTKSSSPSSHGAPSGLLSPNNTIAEHARRRLSEKFGDFYMLHIRHAKLAVDDKTLKISVKNEPQRQILWNNSEAIIKTFNGHITNLLVLVE
jgi:hypothetical protein